MELVLGFCWEVSNLPMGRPGVFGILPGTGESFLADNADATRGPDVVS